MSYLQQRTTSDKGSTKGWETLQLQTHATDALERRGKGRLLPGASTGRPSPPPRQVLQHERQEPRGHGRGIAEEIGAEQRPQDWRDALLDLVKGAHARPGLHDAGRQRRCHIC